MDVSTDGGNLAIITHICFFSREPEIIWFVLTKNGDRCENMNETKKKKKKKISKDFPDPFVS